MRWLLALILALAPITAAAQSDADRGYIQGLLEDAFSGEGRSVRIKGFAGALSSRATIDTLTIADADGVWLTARGVAMQWNRAGLLAGRVDIAELTAQSLDIPRAPLPAADALPTPEARPFALPDLPVSLRVGTLRIDSVTLGAALLGQAAQVQLTGSAALSAGTGAVALDATEARGGALILSGQFDNATRRLVLDLSLREPAGGMVSTLIGLPGAPALDLTLQGDAPVEDFAARLRLATGGTERLTGTATLATLRDPTDPTAPPGWQFAANVAGDAASLFAPEYRAFFGPNVQLSTAGTRTATGALVLDRLQLTADALRISGTAALDPDGWPQRLNLTADLAPPAGGSVLLPLAGAETRVTAGRFKLAFDAGAGEAWSLDAALDGLTRDGNRVDRASLTGAGRISRALSQIEGQIAVAGDGIAPMDPALAQAIGPAARAELAFGWTKGGALELRDMRAEAGPTQIAGAATIAGDVETLTVTPDLTLRAGDLTRFAALADVPLRGRAELRVTGPIQPLTGAFDLTLAGQTQDIGISEPRLDALLRGRGDLTARVVRDAGGLALPQMTIATDAARITAAGRLETGGGDLTAAVQLTDMGQVVAGLSGPAAVQVTAQGRAGVWTVTGDGTGPSLTARATLRQTGGSSDLSFDAQLADLGRFAPDFPGAASARGTARSSNGVTWTVATAVTGPGGISADVTGSATAARLDLRATGAAPLALMNPALRPRVVSGTAQFDLALVGPAALSSLSGTVTTDNAGLALPGERLAFTPIRATARIAAGRAEITATAPSTTGGTLIINGPVALNAPFDANITVEVGGLRLSDPTLYQSRAFGQVTLRGPLAGGAVIAGDLTLDNTELRIPSGGGTSYGGLPGLRHINEPTEVRRTRSFAGLLASDAPANTTPQQAFPVDLILRVPSRLFVRGRGLDAELAGTVRLRGTTAALIPDGRFDMIRGRIDVLGQRLNLTQGSLQLRGSFDPYLSFTAETATSGAEVRIILEGLASAPALRLESSPALPEDEVLALLLFGREVAAISPFQAVRLALAIRTLTGGGDGFAGSIRKGLRLDDLDLRTKDDGTTEARVGAYLSERLYSDVTSDSDGRSEINLNLRLSPSLTLRGSAASDGDTGVGVFFERDY